MCFENSSEFFQLSSDIYRNLFIKHCDKNGAIGTKTLRNSIEIDTLPESHFIGT